MNIFSGLPLEIILYVSKILFFIDIIFMSEVLSEKISKVCRVTSQNVSTSCIFPFEFQGRNFNECTTLEDDRPWCITNNARNSSPRTRNDIEGHWGYCSEECVENRDLEDLFFVNHDMNFLGDDGMTCMECVHWKECSWASTIVNHLKYNLEAKQKNYWIKFMKSQRCGSNGRNICCKAGPKISASTDDPKFGVWKPKSDKLECGTSFDSFFIHGGKNSKLGEFPFLALLGYPFYSLKCRDTVYLCGASLINKHYVLTAAHCLTIPERPLQEIILGEHDLSTNPDCTRTFCAPELQKRKPIKVIVHPKWNIKEPTMGFDIGLVRMDRPVILANEDFEKSFLSPVCLPWNNEITNTNTDESEEAIVAGWGRVTNDADHAYENYCTLGTATSVLQKLNMKTISHEVCNDLYTQFNLSKVQQICSGGEIGKDSCNGDSGGPLIYKDNGLSDTPMYQIGIVSFGTTNCGIGKPGIYTKIAYFMKWIEDSLEP